MAMSLSQAKIPAVEWQMNPICNLTAGTLLQEIRKVNVRNVNSFCTINDCITFFLFMRILNLTAEAIGVRKQKMRSALSRWRSKR
jgi:hypothetical protein